MIFNSFQEALFINCNDLLVHHIPNSTRLTRQETRIDILIFCDFNHKICEHLSEHLAIIFLDGQLKKSTLHIPEKDIKSRFEHKNVKLYDLLQSLIM